MTVINCIGYHTCKTDGGYEHVRKNIPFLSGNGENQWLSQGFYFWTDSAHYAKKWGQVGRRAIGKFEIPLCQKNELLDLNGNVAHSEQLEELLTIVMDRLKITDRNKLNMNRAITYLRHLESTNDFKGIFPYLAIKASDRKCEGRINYIRNSSSWLGTIPRIQMCVFKKAEDRILLKDFVEPKQYASALSKEQV